MNEQPKRRGRPATGRTPLRSIRVPNEEWQAWARAAGGQSISRAIREAMNKWARKANREKPENL